MYRFFISAKEKLFKDSQKIDFQVNKKVVIRSKKYLFDIAVYHPLVIENFFGFRREFITIICVGTR